MTVKDQLHRVIDDMSDPEAAGLLQLIATPGANDDPMAAHLAAAPPDDEPLTAAAREALGDLAADRLVGLVVHPANPFAHASRTLPA